jgi:CheY-like chemotaxis protein
MPYRQPFLRDVHLYKQKTEKAKEEKRMPKVLVIDDDADIRAALADILHTEGFQVEEAANGQEALDILCRDTGGWVLLLDLMMPRMSGPEVLQVFEQDPDLLKTNHIILMSAGWRLARTRQIPQSDLVSGALEKPLEIERMLTLVKRLTT